MKKGVKIIQIGTPCGNRVFSDEEECSGSKIGLDWRKE